MNGLKPFERTIEQSTEPMPPSPKTIIAAAMTTNRITSFSYVFSGEFVLVTWCSLGSIRQLLPGTASNVSKCVGADQEL